MSDEFLINFFSVYRITHTYHKAPLPCHYIQNIRKDYSCHSLAYMNNDKQQEQGLGYHTKRDYALFL